jgi:hypothetical protein
MLLRADTCGVPNNRDGNLPPQLDLVHGSRLEEPIAQVDIVEDPCSGIDLPLDNLDDPAVFNWARSQVFCPYDERHRIAGVECGGLCADGSTRCPHLPIGHDDPVEDVRYADEPPDKLCGRATVDLLPVLI